MDAWFDPGAVMRSVRVVNVTAVTYVSKPLPLRALAGTLPDSTFEPELFAGLIYHRRCPDATLIMFSNGRLASTGARTVSAAIRAIRKTVGEIAIALGSGYRPGTIRVRNLTAMLQVTGAIDLERLAAEKYGSVEYSPRTFPGLIAKGSNSTRFLVFSNGKIVCVGAKSRREILAGLEWLAKCGDGTGSALPIPSAAVIGT